MLDERRYEIGAEVQSAGTHFRVWAPDRRRVEIVSDSGPGSALSSEDNGYFSGLIKQAPAGSLYQVRLDGDDPVPDPVSRFQPSGPHGPSQVIDPCQFKWTDQKWVGRGIEDLIIYEMHVGTFTTEGTWAAAIKQLPELADIGINCIEVMPVADFAGNFGWGYDGVNLFAPTRLYGTPDEFRQFVNSAHEHQIAVLLDVVYNHLGPDGNYLGKFASAYFTDRYKTDWGAAINFDGDSSRPVREYFLTNAAYWIDEFHLDGLRLDATQNIYDNASASEHILTQIAESARAAAPERKVVIVAENEPQHPRLCRPVAEDGYGLDAVWNDDYHHTAMVALNGQREAYYADYGGSPQEFISAAKYGYLYQGQWYSWQDQRRGQPGLDLPVSMYINYIQNHDQVANSAKGLRVDRLTSPGRYRALTALTILMPGTPMLFQGQEFAASAPFLFFADHTPELAKMVQSGRAEFLSQFPSIADPAIQAMLTPPHEPQTFQRCKLNFAERELHADAYRLSKAVLKLRRTDPAFQSTPGRRVDGAVIAPQAFVLRYFHNRTQDRLVIVNLGVDIDLAIVPEPLLAPPSGMRWRTLLSTAEAQFGGHGVSSLELAQGGWHIPAETTVVLAGEKFSDTKPTDTVVQPDIDLRAVS